MPIETMSRMPKWSGLTPSFAAAGRRSGAKMTRAGAPSSTEPVTISMRITMRRKAAVPEEVPTAARAAAMCWGIRLRVRM
ncbi:MAG: hypothetical protein M0002_03705 [Rhodospirillales bacterium]|nr:hypothetical protein [Rhodospirillales bacterium]